MAHDALAPPLRAILVVWLALASGWFSQVVRAEPYARPAEVELPLASDRSSIWVKGTQARRWRQGAYDVWLFSGRAQITQGERQYAADEAVLWIDRATPHTGQYSKVLLYLEGNVSIDEHRDDGVRPVGLRDRTWFGRLKTLSRVEVEAPVVGGEPHVKPAVWQHGIDARTPAQAAPAEPSGAVALAQFTAPAGPLGAPGSLAPGPLTPGPGLPGPPLAGGALPAAPLAAETPGGPAGLGAPGGPVGARSIEFRQRSGVAPNILLRNLPERNESVALLTGGANLVIDEVVIAPGGERQPLPLGRVDIEADQIVAWSTNLPAMFSAGGGAPSLQPQDVPLELYLEGNIVFRQGDRVIYADKMYFNVAARRGVVFNAELLTDVPSYEGLVRLRAEVLRLVNERRFEARNASLTSSRMGVPRYWFQTGELAIEDDPQVATDPLTGRPTLDPVTGEPALTHRFRATSRRNAVYVGGVPVLFWPVMSTDLQASTFYINQVRVKSDRIFGQQLQVDWNLFQLLGFEEPPEGTTWTLSTDYLSLRGPAVGTQLKYDRDQLFGLTGPAHGLVDFWGLHDDGVDRLGSDRLAVVPEESWRYRGLWQHRQEFGDGFQLTAEFGKISDRNFLEQFFEPEWDTWKDESTGVELKQYLGLATWSVAADVRLNEFFMQTEHLPTLEHTLIGRPLLNGVLTWHEHTSIGYDRLRTATAPLDPVELAKFDPLYGEVERQGVVAATRQELDMPLTVGALQITPYVMGEAAYYQEDINGADLGRLLGQVGVRNSLSFWKSMPEVQNTLFNLNGLAHKVDVETEFLYADASQDLSNIPRYDQIDDDATEFFRRRFFFDTFGGMAGMDVAPRFDERVFAVRSGMQQWVTGPTDLVDDLMMGKVGVKQRLQTKRGLPGQERIIDWMVLDIDANLYPRPDRDNFGMAVGMLRYDYRWHVGDRLTLLSDGFADFFTGGLQTFSAGGIIHRPDRGNLYLGYRSVEGPFSSNILASSLDYRLSPKWIAHYGASFDFGSTGNIGQQFGLTRIGESALLRFGVSYDRSRNNFGLQLMLEPRFMPAARLRRVAGIDLPPYGSQGIE